MGGTKFTNHRGPLIERFGNFPAIAPAQTSVGQIKRDARSILLVQDGLEGLELKRLLAAQVDSKDLLHRRFLPASTRKAHSKFNTDRKSPLRGLQIFLESSLSRSGFTT